MLMFFPALSFQWSLKTPEHLKTKRLISENQVVDKQGVNPLKYIHVGSFEEQKNLDTQPQKRTK